MPTTTTSLRYTLDCQAVPWHVLHVEESKSLARPPGVVLDVTAERPLAELAEVERATASLLIEGPSGSRVVRGWVRYLEPIGIVDARAHLRLHLVPLAMAEDAPVRRVEAPAEPPVMLADPLPAEEQDVTAEHTPEELRAMRGEDAEDEVHRRTARQHVPRVPVRTGQTQLTPRENLERLAPGPRRRTKGSTTETERLEPIIGAAEDERPAPRRDARDHAPERKRRKKRKLDDETSQMTWAQLEAFHRDRSKPRT